MQGLNVSTVRRISCVWVDMSLVPSSSGGLPFSEPVYADVQARTSMYRTYKHVSCLESVKAGMYWVT